MSEARGSSRLALTKRRPRRSYLTRRLYIMTALGAESRPPIAGRTERGGRRGSALDGSARVDPRRACHQVEVIEHVGTVCRGASLGECYLLAPHGQTVARTQWPTLNDAYPSTDTPTVL